MNTLKKVPTILINWVFLAVVFGIINNKIKWSIHDSKIKQGSILIEYFDIKDDIMIGAIVVICIYAIYGLLYLVLFKKMNVILVSCLLASLSYSIPYFLIRTFVLHSQSTLWISLLPFLVIGFLLPIMQKWITLLINKPSQQ